MICGCSSEKYPSIGLQISEASFENLNLHAGDHLAIFHSINRLSFNVSVADRLETSHLNVHVVGVSSAFEAVIRREAVDRHEFIANKVGCWLRLRMKICCINVGRSGLFAISTESVFDLLKFRFDEILKKRKIKVKVKLKNKDQRSVNKIKIKN